MLIPILKPEEKIIYGACQYLKDKYKDGNIVGIYAAYCIDDQWVYHYGKTSLKDGKVETIDNYIIYGNPQYDAKLTWKRRSNPIPRTS